MSCNDAILAGC